MNGESWKDVEEAFSIVNLAYDAKKIEEGQYDGPPVIRGHEPFGALVPLSDPETQQLNALRNTVARYVKQKQHARPLCIAIFGPPGSGKSFAVKEILQEIKRDPSVKLHWTEINLTQLSSPAELTEILAGAPPVAADVGAVPVVFFDEFDTPRDGAPYGWLSSFLAPMHDGAVLSGRTTVTLKKAVYVFAGGTASTMEEFSDLQSRPEFREAKGPDFISRLRAFLDVLGPNQSRRTLRRAVILRSELIKRVKRNGSGTFTVEEALLRALLQVGRYRHGARSIAALIELADLDSEELDWKLLPDDHLVALHVDRGPLDAKAIEGSIALSGFGTDTGPGVTPTPDATPLGEAWTQVAQGLWEEGATLSYAGGLSGPGIDLVNLLLKALTSLPLDLSRRSEKRERPYPRFRAFIHGLNPEEVRAATDAADKVRPERDRVRMGVQVVPGTYLDREEQAWGDTWKARAVERFRRRLAVSESSVARFVVGGMVSDPGERPSGVVDEVIQSLALGRPVYLAGGFGGATEDLGTVLGLSGIRTGVIPQSLREPLTEEKQKWLDEIVTRLRPPPLTSLPVSLDEQVSFLRDHALGGPLWPHNGLSKEENRELFRSTLPGHVRYLVVKGLRRVFSDR